jgi:5-hydroxyisourate hydrolase
VNEASDNLLTTHVLDVARGRPAAGVDLVLSRFVDGVASSIASATTNADGRTDTPLLVGDAFVAGRYELAFGVGDYFAALGEDAAIDGDVADPEAIAYLDVVPVHFGVAAGTTHLHVALLVTPWSYTTYRGS